MILAPVAAQLAGIPRAVIDDTTGLAEIVQSGLRAPLVIYVIPGDEKGQEANSTLGYWLEQFIDIGVDVVVAVKPAAVRGGQAADLETLKEAVKGKLIGWQAPGFDRPTIYLGAALLRLDAEVMAMMLRFTIRLRVRVNTPGGN